MMAYGLMALVAVLAMGWMLRPWWSRRAQQDVQRRGLNVAAYRTRVQEIEAEVAAGLLDADAAQALKDELGTRLVSDVEHASTTATPVSDVHVRWPWALALLLPLFAAVGYYLADSWRTQATLDAIAAHPEQTQQLTLDAMLRQLETQVQKQPDDADSWAMLGRSYFTQGRYASASEAYHRANALNGGSNADSLVGEGEALAMTQGRNLLNGPDVLFEKALKLDADHGRALWYAGLVAMQKHDDATAIAHWSRLRQQELPPELAQALDERLHEMSKRSGIALPKVPAIAQGGVRLALRVELSPALKDKVPAGATLLVFAKAAEGPPMPLAVQKLKPYRLPMSLTLDDSMAMLPQLKLSGFPKWVITARITTSDDVRAKAGDLQGQVTLTREDASQPQVLRISSVVGDPLSAATE